MWFIVLQNFFIRSKRAVSNYQYCLIALTSLTGAVKLYYKIIDIIKIKLLVTTMYRFQFNTNILPYLFLKQFNSAHQIISFQIN